MNKNILDFMSGSLMIIGIGIMAVGILGEIYTVMNDIESGIGILVVAGFGIVFVGGILSLATPKERDALVSQEVVGGKE